MKPIATRLESWWLGSLVPAIQSVFFNGTAAPEFVAGFGSLESQRTVDSPGGRQKIPAPPFRRIVRSVAVIGSDRVGVSWSAFYLAHGFDVVAADPSAGGADALRQNSKRVLSAILKFAVPGEATKGSLRFTSDVGEAVMRADFVQECSPDDPCAQISLLGEIDRCTRPDCIIASSVSRPTMAAVQARSRFPERCIIARPLDLPHLNPFVYVVSAPKTSPAAIKQAMAFYGSKGKLPIYLRNEISDEFSDSLLQMFHIEVGRLREQNILGDTDVQDFVSWGPHLCGTLLIRAIQPDLNGISSNSCTDRAEDVPGAQVINGSQF